MLVEDIQSVLEELAPGRLSAGWDNSGLQVGRATRLVGRVLVTLDVTEDVVREAADGDFQVILSHHPLLFEPLRRVSDGDRRGRIVSQLLASDISVIACHTNLDAAEGGLADLAAGELGLTHTQPISRIPVGGVKFVGFIPREAYEDVVAAAYEAGAGALGDYSHCSFNSEGRGTFMPGEGADPYVGARGRLEKAEEIRWETLVPTASVASVIHAFVKAHPYEEPAFDIYPLENVGSSGGLGRIGTLRAPTTLERVATSVGELLNAATVVHTGDPERSINSVAVVPGSGMGLLEDIPGRAEVLITGDVKYHDAERAQDLGLDLVVAPHGLLEVWALRAWSQGLRETLEERGVEVVFAEAGGSAWRSVSMVAADSGEVISSETGSMDFEGGNSYCSLFVDGGARGNPGPAAIGVVLRDEAGEVLEEVWDRIGDTTNNVAEYHALITGLETALDRSVTHLEVFSDSELMVRQMNREYKVRSERLKELFMQARALVQQFKQVRISHVSRESNTDADALVNKALDGV